MLNYPSSETDPCRKIMGDQIRRFARAHGVPLLEPEPVMGVHRFARGPGAPEGPIESVMYARDGHPNARGYGRIAGAVFKRLRDLSWVR